MFKRAFTAIFLLTCFAILIALGLWQVHRLEWKTNILNEIAVYEGVDITTHKLDLDAPLAPFMRGRVDGQFFGKPVYIGPRTHDKESGFHVVMPFKTSSGVTIIVNRGWIQAADKDKAVTFPKTNYVGGYLMAPDQPSMTPNNRPTDGFWYWADVQGIQSYYGIQTPSFILYQEAPALDGAPIPFDGMPKPRNKHFQYAAFWFGMAGLLAILLVLFSLRKRS